MSILRQLSECMDWLENLPMDCNDIRPGLRVRTTKLGDTVGMLIHERYLSVRRAGVTGAVLQYVAGHGGDVWYVRHDGAGEVAAYAVNELEPAAPAPAPDQGGGVQSEEER